MCLQGLQGLQDKNFKKIVSIFKSYLLQILSIQLISYNQFSQNMNQQQEITVEHFQSDKVHFRTLLRNFGKIIAFVFYSEANPQSKEFLENLKNSIPMFGVYDNVVYFAVSAEKCPETFEKYNVEKTPTVVLTETSKKIHHRHEDQNIGTFFDVLSTVAAQKKVEHQKLKPIFFKKCEDLLRCSPLIIFMKGTPTAPKCGFIRQLLEILVEHNMEYAFYNIDADEDIRHWLRLYKNHPTYPQIYLQGKFLGGLDSLREIIAKNELHTTFPDFCFKASTEERLEKYLKSHENDRIIFVNGYPFESEQSAKFVDIHAKKSENEYIWNAGLDKELQGIVESKFKKSIPFVVEKGQLSE